MAALSYVLLPLSGVLAFLLSRSARVRSHGLQAIALGTAWPVLLYVASALAPVITWIVALAGAGIWIAFLCLTAFGRDPKLPVLGAWFFALSQSEQPTNGA